MKIKKCTIEHFRLLSRATIDFRGGNLGGNRWQRYTLFIHFYKNCHFIIKIISYCILYQKSIIFVLVEALPTGKYLDNSLTEKP